MICRYIALGETTLGGFSMAERLSAGSIPTGAHLEAGMDGGHLGSRGPPHLLFQWPSIGIIIYHFRA